MPIKIKYDTKNSIISFQPLKFYLLWPSSTNKLTLKVKLFLKGGIIKKFPMSARV